jgi:hypothetical protein
MTTIMLNFMIAVIMDTYDDVTLIEDRYKYQGRAELNNNHYELLQFFPSLKFKKFRLIIFSDSKEVNDEEKLNDNGDIKSEVMGDVKTQINGYEVNETALEVESLV